MTGLRRGLTGAALASLALVLAAAATANAAPRCFGAASRDPEVPCVNRALRLLVTPTPAQALRAPNAPCDVVARRPFVRCAFGASARSARSTFALVGDNHAGHWRGAMEVVARARRWHGVSITHSSCPLSVATRRARPAPARARRR